MKGTQSKFIDFSHSINMQIANRCYKLPGDFELLALTLQSSNIKDTYDTVALMFSTAREGRLNLTM